MRTSLTVLCAACALLFGCQDSNSSRPQLNELQMAQQEYAAWAAMQPRPSKQLVERIEMQLAQIPRVGRLDQWSRSFAYNYDIPNEVLYPEIVDFHLEEAEGRVQPGQRIRKPNAWLVDIDDRPIRMVSGDYDIAEDRIRVEFCGNNTAGERPRGTDIHNTIGYWDELERRRAMYQAARSP